MRALLWWRDTSRLYIRYLTVAGASLPLAAAYGYLTANGIDHWFFTAPLLVAGFGCGLLGWRVSERFFRPEMERVGPNGLMVRVAAVAMTATFAVLCAENPHVRPLQVQRNLLSGEIRVSVTRANTSSLMEG